MVAGDRDRERAVATLREHFVGGRLSVEDLARRTEQALAARSREELRTALAGLPLVPDPRELLDRGRAAARRVVLVLLGGVWLVFTIGLAIALVVTLLLRGASTPELVAFLVVWLVPTYLLARSWKRTPPQRRSTR